MKLHGNAALSWSGRRVVARRVVVEGWTVSAWEVDAGETGKNTDRPAFKEAMRMVAEGEADGLVAAKLDRSSPLYRTQRECASASQWRRRRWRSRQKA